MRNRTLLFVLSFLLIGVLTTVQLFSLIHMESDTNFDQKQDEMSFFVPEINSLPPSSGDWNITDTTILENTEYIINGSIFINNGGTLVLKNTTLYMNLTYNGEFWIDVENGAKLTILENSVITAYNTSNKYYIRVFSGAKFLMDNSEISYSGYDAGEKSGLWINTNDTIVRNSQINNVYGVYFWYSYNNTMTNNNLSSIIKCGADIRQSSNITLVNNTISDGYNGLSVRDSNNITLINNTIYNTGEDCIYMYNVSVFNLINNTIFNNNWKAVDMFSSNNITLFNNTIFNSSREGVYISVCSDVIIRNNTIHSNGLSVVPGGSGIYTTDSTKVAISNNNIFSNTYSAGIFIDSSNGTVINNTLMHNMYGIYLTDINSSCEMYVANNTLQYHSTAGLVVQMSSDVITTNNTVSNNGEYGILVGSSNNVTITETTISDNQEIGISIATSDNVTVSNNTIDNNQENGVFLNEATNLTIINNTFLLCGLFVMGSNIDRFNHTVTDNTVNNKPLRYIFNQTNVVVGDAGQIIAAYSQGIIIGNMNISNTDYGIEIFNSNDITFENNTFSHNYVGIFNMFSNNFTFENNTFLYEEVDIAIFYANAPNNHVIIVNNTFSNTDWESLYFESDYNVTIINNTISNSKIGIYMESCNKFTIYNNIISSNNDRGIWIKDSNDITIINNTLSNIRFYGMIIQDTTNVTVTDNTFTNCGLLIEGYNKDHFNHTVIDNTVNGAPLLYIFDQKNVIVEDPGQVIIAYSQEIIIRDLDLSNASVGIQVRYSGNITIDKNILSHNTFGICMDYTDNITITNNTIDDILSSGIKLVFCNNIDILKNSVSNASEDGISMYNCDNVSLSINTLSDNNRGFYMDDFCDNVVIFMNNFINNTEQAHSDKKINFDNGTIGNYWDDYTGADSNGDGIGDTPYYIEYNSADNHPLMNPLPVYPDVKSPEIVSVDQTPTVPNDKQQVLIKANVTDEIGVSCVILSYYNGTVWKNVTMVYNSTSGYYEAEIPALPVNTEVQYKIYAEDTYCNLRISSTFSYTVVASDTEGPEITDITHTPSTPNDLQDVLVRANVTDENVILQVILSYYDGSKWNNVSMEYNSTSGYYEAEIPALSVGTTIQYKIYAEDSYHNWNVSSTFSYTVISSDTIPPEIVNVTHIPTTPDNLQDVLVRANVTDESGISQVILSYYNGSVWKNITMTYNSTSGYYEAEIPALPAETQVQYKIYAEDTYGNWAVSGAYTYTVIQAEVEGELPIMIIIIIVVTITGVILFTVIILKIVAKRKLAEIGAKLTRISSTINSIQLF